MKMTKKTILKRCVAVILAGIFLVESFNPKISEAAGQKKITKTITITDKYGFYHNLSIKENTEMNVTVKFLEVSGCVKGKDYAFGGHDISIYKNGKIQPESGMCPLWAEYGSDKYLTKKLRKADIKKGKTLSATAITVKKGRTGETCMYWTVPKGIKNIKMQVTYYTKKGNKGITKFKSRTARKGIDYDV